MMKNLNIIECEHVVGGNLTRISLSPKEWLGAEMAIGAGFGLGSGAIMGLFMGAEVTSLAMAGYLTMGAIIGTFTFPLIVSGVCYGFNSVSSLYL